MKINIIGCEPVYVSDDRAKAIVTAISRGVELIEINDGYYKPSAISSIVPGEEPASFYGKGLMLNAYIPNSIRPKEEQHNPGGRQRYLEMRRKLGI